MEAFVDWRRFSSGYVVVAFLLAVPCMPMAGQEQPVIGMVLEINGNVCHPSQRNHDSYKFDEKKDVGYPILDGELFRLGKDSWIKIEVGPKIRTIASDESPYRVHPDFPLTRLQEEYAKAVRAEFAASGPQAGARGVWEPSLGSALRVSSATIRWEFSGGVLDLILKDKSNHVIWSESRVDASPGELDEARRNEFRAVLMTQQEQSKSADLTLATNRVGGISQEIPFTVISHLQETALDAQLTEVDREEISPIPRALARGRVFSEVLMYADAVIEFESALKLAPQSTHILQATIRLLQTTGSASKAGELKAKLANGADVRESCSLPEP